MDTVTHTLAGWTMARAGAERLGPYTTPALLVAANIPDIGFVHLVAGPGAFLRYGAWAHSLIGATALGAGVGWAFWRWGRRRAPALQFRGLLLAGSPGRRIGRLDPSPARLDHPGGSHAALALQR
jgi:membrane-bound metal-dependent hydrolase YbcI (DUF457 family)